MNPIPPRPSACDELKAIQEQLSLNDEFPEPALAEAEAWLRAPRVDDPALVDRTALPFVTVDGASSRDLDQALYLERDETGFTAAYAIADASFYVRPGTALFGEALKRGASYYFPGYSVPMLPRSLSEGLISLNPDGPRRALVFFHRLDADGSLLETRLERARIHSRAKLSFADVQRLIDHPESSALAGQPFETSLRLLREVGRLRMHLAESRGLVRYRREEVAVELDGEGLRFAVMEMVRDEVESWNEQLSLLCNSEGGRLLRECTNPAVQPIYRVQPGPAPERLEGLARLTEALAARWGLPPDPWVWDASTTTLADYLAGLPTAPNGSREDRLARALARQAVMVNLRSAYSTEPGLHAGVGAEPYARFSAPMREIVGVFLHKEAVEMLTGESGALERDEVLRQQVVSAANRSRETQRQVQNLANAVVLNRLFEPELRCPPGDRTRFRATVMGIGDSKVYVRLDEPPLDVKLYFFDLARSFQDARLEPAESGAVLRVRGTAEPLMLLGQTVTLAVSGKDDRRSRWLFDVTSEQP